GRIIEPDTTDLTKLNRYMLLLRSNCHTPKAHDLAQMLRGFDHYDQFLSSPTPAPHKDAVLHHRTSLCLCEPSLWTENLDIRIRRPETGAEERGLELKTGRNSRSRD
ncbi:MAG: hypothetical protein WAV78_11880, partial [Xanthobacteraceae bacterium]